MVILWQLLPQGTVIHCTSQSKLQSTVISRTALTRRCFDIWLNELIKEEKIAVKTLLKNFPSFHPFESCWKSNCIIISLVQVDIHCKKNELQIVGYYQANEHINDNRWVKSTSKNIKFLWVLHLKKGCWLVKSLWVR